MKIIGLFVYIKFDSKVMEDKKMMEEIFVGILVVVAIGAGVWVWWFENMAGKDVDQEKQVKEKSNSKVVDK